jgi:hypothetical protein
MEDIMDNGLRCIICKEPRSEKKLSDEHVFPEAIGGSLKLNRVCRDCNSTLGTKVDAPLVNHHLVQFARQKLNLAGKTGNIPNPLLGDGVLLADRSQKVRVIQDSPDLPYRVELLPKVEVDDSEAGKLRYAVSVDRRQEGDLPSIVNKAITRKGLPPLPEEEIWARARYVNGDVPQFERSIGADNSEYRRGLLKIAYELGFLWLGEAYLDDPVGEALRQCIIRTSVDLDELIEEHQICGQLGFVDKARGPRLPHTPQYHVAHCLRIGSAVGCYLRIFNAFEGDLLITRTATNYPQYEDRFIEIDSTTKKHRQLPSDVAKAEIIDAHGLYWMKKGIVE